MHYRMALQRELLGSMKIRQKYIFFVTDISNNINRQIIIDQSSHDTKI